MKQTLESWVVRDESREKEERVLYKPGPSFTVYRSDPTGHVLTAVATEIEEENFAHLIAEAPNLLKLVEEAFERFTDNDMQPPNQKLRDWLAMAAKTLYQINPNAPGRE